MSFSKEEYLDLFVEHLEEFITDIALIFKEDKKVQLLKEGIIFCCEFSKERCIRVWTLTVCKHFRKQIEENDFNFFIDQSDWSKIITHKHKDNILLKINELRESVRGLSDSNKNKALKYVENLTKLADLYNNQTTI